MKKLLRVLLAVLILVTSISGNTVFASYGEDVDFLGNEKITVDSLNDRIKIDWKNNGKAYYYQIAIKADNGNRIDDYVQSSKYYFDLNDLNLRDGTRVKVWIRMFDNQSRSLGQSVRYYYVKLNDYDEDSILKKQLGEIESSIDIYESRLRQRLGQITSLEQQIKQTRAYKNQQLSSAFTNAFMQSSDNLILAYSYLGLIGADTPSTAAWWSDRQVSRWQDNVNSGRNYARSHQEIEEAMYSISRYLRFVEKYTIRLDELVEERNKVWNQINN